MKHPTLLLPLLLFLAGCAKSVPTPNAAPAAEPRATSPQSTAIFRDGTRQTIYKDPETATTATFPKPPNVMAAAEFDARATKRGTTPAKA